MPTVTETLNQLSNELNTLLAAKVQDLESQLSRSDISILDMNILFEEILPPELTGANESCVLGPPLAHAAAPTDICDNPDEVLFFDEVHPTTLVHEYVSQTALQVLGAKAQVGKLSHLVIFGDSLSDYRNVFSFSAGNFPPPVATVGPLAGEALYAPGAFTNGLLWWQYLIQTLEMPHPVAYYERLLTENLPLGVPKEGINFAVGGAATGKDNTGNAQSPPFPLDLPGLGNQVSAFYDLLGDDGEADSSALYIIWAGSNNLLGRFLPLQDCEEHPEEPCFGPFPDFQKSPERIISDIEATIRRLYDRGARNFLVGNFYPLGNTPLGQELEDIAPEGLEDIFATKILTLPGAIPRSAYKPPTKKVSLIALRICART